ncbi:hypothetical protein COW36_21320 [bacterium (Candidatus Blackallbacteria) CG17_big_fil_post_rev_8_21_14_2_50_48_46]|uniref:DUF4253 domain-containing protein n=1 Tax=bacterium (Candidatus Blackallbacteria) CG17_big_fil_post_rev_8_21_14_2_50_48_46 TaxID=2014261 RepID=A0A2M7FYZ2_9BACT|nr:MAG: hypothetical protein COW64_14630 [bacterium (Candidatus Blackallbacteria) CG18_big_fil_WC_8_21_14_2_50_49_26]PIW14581.1 MAG: hypothetical protein COW36_21320 [bacterium (Candidatus Blackallbacteria) CG17_big_fil_post_rev_8_21_14_2_50_48_46]PIW47266.1 MAG: hypothetical protein COW20_13765 [bacterium (Candidatus Blackallbacteria) CG13_big_fil_rev_8_21_14_2_50_49_14]
MAALLTVLRIFVCTPSKWLLDVMPELENLLKQNGFSQALQAQVIPGAEQPLYFLSLPGKTAIETWQKLRAFTPEAGYWPVLLGPVSDLELLKNSWSFTDSLPSPQAVLKSAASLDLQKWLAAHASEEDLELDLDEFDEFAEFFTPENMQPQHHYAIHVDILSRQPYAEVLLALVPTPHSWEVPAWLHTGGWNACPDSDVHIRLMETWFVRYGAELVSHSHDLIELRIARPVQNLDEARELARLQYAYCPDIVEQGVQTLENLALTLIDSTVWYFWWD